MPPSDPTKIETMTQIQSEVTRERLFDEFTSVVTETERLLQSLATAGSGEAGTLEARVEQGLASAAERVAAIREKSLEQATAVTRAADGYVRDNAWQVAGLAAAVCGITGLVAGLLIARR